MNPSTQAASSPLRTPGRPYRWATGRTVAVLILAFGSTVRIVQFVADRSLWYDEMMLAFSFVHRPTLSALFAKPLSYWQVAPAGYTALLHVLTALFGYGDRVFRSPALLAGLAAPVLFCRLARRMLRPGSATIALLIFASLGPLIYYSNEAKPYALDVFFAVAILLAAHRFQSEPTSWRNALVLAVTGFVAIPLSFPAIFVLGGVGTVLFARALLRLQRWELATLAAAGAAWAGMFLLNYFFFIRPVFQVDVGPGLVQTWSAAGFPPTSIADWPQWIWDVTNDLFGGTATMWLLTTPLAIALALVGLVLMWRDHRAALLLLLSPIGPGVIAAVLRKYPFADRLILYLVPMGCLLLAAGIVGLADRGGALGRFAGVVATAVLLMPTLTRDVEWISDPPGREEIRQVMQYVAAHAQPDDWLYQYHNDDVSMTYYGPRFGLDRMQTLMGGNFTSDPSKFMDEIESIPPTIGRVWFLFTHDWNANGLDEEELILTEAARRGTMIDQTEARGADAFLFDFSEAPTTQ